MKNNNIISLPTEFAVSVKSHLNKAKEKYQDFNVTKEVQKFLTDHPKIHFTKESEDGIKLKYTSSNILVRIIESAELSTQPKKEQVILNRDHLKNGNDYVLSIFWEQHGGRISAKKEPFKLQLSSLQGKNHLKTLQY